MKQVRLCNGPQDLELCSDPMLSKGKSTKINTQKNIMKKAKPEKKEKNPVSIRINLLPGY